MDTLRKFVESEKIMIVAHRGASSSSPENTIAAFREAMSVGVNFIECDVQITADKKLVVYHDFIPNNYKKCIKDIKYNELDFNRINPNADLQFKKETIPLLRDVLELAKNKAYLVLELKIIDDENYEEIINHAIDIIESYEYSDKVLFASFHHKSLMKIKEIDSRLHTAAIKIPGDNRLPSDLLKEFDFDAFICSVTEIDDYIDGDIRSNNIFCGVYSVDSMEDLEKVNKYEIKAYGTNNPKWLIEELKI